MGTKAWKRMALCLDLCLGKRGGSEGVVKAPSAAEEVEFVGKERSSEVS